MSSKAKTFKSPELALKELERFIRSPKHLYSGRRFKTFHGMLPRELLVNWLLCAVMNSMGGWEVVLSSDPSGGDGIIIDAVTGKWWETEHVMTPPPSKLPVGEDIHSLILNAINHKRKKGITYARGKTLVVFIGGGGGGSWFPRRIAREQPKPLLFSGLWVVGLVTVEGGEYTYGVSCFDESAAGGVTVFLVSISKNFETWTVRQQD